MPGAAVTILVQPSTPTGTEVAVLTPKSSSALAPPKSKSPLSSPGLFSESSDDEDESRPRGSPADGGAKLSGERKESERDEQEGVEEREGLAKVMEKEGKEAGLRKSRSVGEDDEVVGAEKPSTLRPSARKGGKENSESKSRRHSSPSFFFAAFAALQL